MTELAEKSYTPSPKGLEMLNALRKAVVQELEKKKRLGQSAVVWRDGQAVVVEAEVALVKATE